MCDYIEDKEILDYTPLIKIHFDDYISPSVENVTEVLARQVTAGIKSKKHALKDLNEEYDDKDAENELLDILSENGALALQDETPDADVNMENNTPKNVNLENSDSMTNTNLENSNSYKG